MAAQPVQAAVAAVWATVLGAGTTVLGAGTTVLGASAADLVWTEVVVAAVVRPQEAGAEGTNIIWQQYP
ncbi:MAG TPA: hypothetical protein PLU87_19655 [Sedimentisphaerales bacterium]|nr:hypothetical protein [Sedimentisphaerales bacterium]HRS13310.1 hypothetical protein [Sedimentisphaerales bacterium]HRV49950.1 hypothetical protein [Sedimentisphaerales bacterium]